MAFSDYLKTKLLDHTLGRAAYTMPANVFVGLFVGDPEASGVEASGAGYARQQASFAAPVDGHALNSAVVLFPQALAGWGTLTHFAVFDAASGGHRLASGLLRDSDGEPSPLPVAAMEQPIFNPGQLLFGFTA